MLFVSLKSIKNTNIACQRRRLTAGLSETVEIHIWLSCENPLTYKWSTKHEQRERMRKIIVIYIFLRNQY